MPYNTDCWTCVDQRFLSGNIWLGIRLTQTVKNLPVNAGDVGSIPGWGRSPGGGHGNPLQSSCLENPMDGGAWWATVHGVAKSQTRLSDSQFDFFTFYFSFLMHLWLRVFCLFSEFSGCIFPADYYPNGFPDICLMLWDLMKFSFSFLILVISTFHLSLLIRLADLFVRWTLERTSFCFLQLNLLYIYLWKEMATHSSILAWRIL